MRAGTASALAFTSSALVVGALLAANGGWFPASSSWASLALFWAVAIALLLVPVARPRPLELAYLGALVALAAWTALSLAWTSDVTQTVWDAERLLVLVGGIAAVAALAPRHPVRPLLGGVLLGIVVACAYGLATRLFPMDVGHFDSVGTYRLNAPVGYWNGLGLIAVMGTILAVGFAARERRAVTSALAGASLLVLLPTLYFTYSRGAWIALAVGVAVALALDPGRLGLALALLVLAVVPAAALLAASHSDALTHQQATLAAARTDGHSLALLLVVLSLAEAAIAALLCFARQRVAIPRVLRTAWATLLCAAVVLGLVLGVARYGSPAQIASRGYDAFTAPPVQAGSDLNSRLFDLSNNGRVELWRAAWHEAQAQPLLGGGAGSYGRWWLEHRSSTQNVHDAHSLYLETLAELGPPGLALLAVVLALPLLGAWRARRHPLVPVGCAAYVAFLVHAAADWDWELAGIALAASFCGFACLAAGRDDESRWLGPRVRHAAVAVAAALAVVAFVGVIGNTSLERSDAAARSRDWTAAARHADNAIRWMPWSAAGWQRRGEARLGAGDAAAARYDLARALDRDSGDWVIWLDYAGATEGAEQARALTQVVRLNPSDPALGALIAAAVGRRD